jgi:N-methylhydantoinase A
MTANSLFLGIDTGGTFTDFVLVAGGFVRVHKVLSTPDAPERAILRGIRELGLEPAGLRVVHGSTVATNAVLEGKGVQTLFITNRGFTDLLTIGRQARQALYDLQPPVLPSPVPRELCHGTGGRIGSDGTVLEPLTTADLGEIEEVVARQAPTAVAVNLLFSYLDDRAEKAIRSCLPDDLFVSLSSEVLPEIREYERGIATWLNAYVGPLVEGYLRRLRGALPGSSVSVIQSSGDTVSAGQAGGQAVRMLLSGPAGGLVGAGFVGHLAGRDRLLTFDMGGTSTDVALVDGAPRLTREGRIGRFPVAVPMVDMHTIGAGGGSIATVDAGGMLRVGPASAGADPGPACYGLGGAEATVTDANLVLGRLRADAFLGGGMTLDVNAAEAALDRIAMRMGCSRFEAADGIVAVANEHMARALRVISIQRGEDPREFTLASFGGAGGLHVCALAEALEMTEVIVPVHAGVLSALGMLAGRPGRQLSRTLPGVLGELNADIVEAGFAELELEGRAFLAEEGIALDSIAAGRSVDLRYLGQSYTLNVPWKDPADAANRFRLRHLERYGHELDAPVELVNVRLGIHGHPVPFELEGVGTSVPARPCGWSDVGRARAAVYRREELAPEQLIRGPAIVTETVATTWVAAGWRCRVDSWGNLMLTLV